MSPAHIKTIKRPLHSSLLQSAVLLSVSVSVLQVLFRGCDNMLQHSSARIQANGKAVAERVEAICWCCYTHTHTELESGSSVLRRAALCFQREEWRLGVEILYDTKRTNSQSPVNKEHKNRHAFL